MIMNTRQTKIHSILVLLMMLMFGSISGIAEGLSEVVLPTCAMKIVKNLIIIKDDVK